MNNKFMTPITDQPNPCTFTFYFNKFPSETYKNIPEENQIHTAQTLIKLPMEQQKVDL